jgi:hypothetical protein
MLKNLSELEQYNQLVDVLSEVKIFTGALMYSDYELKIQIDVLRQFLTTHPKIKNFTINEIRHAFYLNNFGEYPTIYRHFNRELNAEFIGDVLLAYLKFKKEFLSRSQVPIRSLLYPKAMNEKPLLTEELLKAMIQEDYEKHKAANDRFIFNIQPKYIFLRKKLLIQLSSKASWNRNYNLAMQYRAKEQLPSTVQNKEREQLYKQIQTSGLIPIKEHRLLVAQTRRIIYFKFFDLLWTTAIQQIFTDIDY